MPKIKIRDHRPRSGNRKKLLWNRLMTLNLLIYKIEDNRNFFIVVSSNEIIDKILTEQVKDALRKDDFEVTTPPEYNANRTVVIRNVDSIITELDHEELKLDIERRNEWAKIVEIIKIPTAPKILKLRFENAEMVKKAMEVGMLIYN